MALRFDVGIATFAVFAAHASAQNCVTEQLTFAPGGASLDNDSERPVLSADGRFVAFVSAATNTGHVAMYGQVYLLDRANGVLDLVSQSSGGVASTHAQGVGWQYTSALRVSQSGRFVLFMSDAGNLVANDTNTPPPQGVPSTGLDVFLRDRVTGQTITPNRMPDGTTGQGASTGGAMTSDARWITFATANRLVAADTNDLADVYLFERASGATTWIGLTSSGEGPELAVMVNAISDDGRFVVLTTPASKMVDGDTNGWSDVFVRDLASGAVERISVDSSGVQGNRSSRGVAISPDGRFVLFVSDASNWAGHVYPAPDLYVRDRANATTLLVSVREDGTPVFDAGGASAMSADARFIVFESDALGVLDDDPFVKSDVFLRDTWQSKTTLVSATPSGDFSAAHSNGAGISADGRVLVFSSKSGVLTNPGIGNQVEDIFVRDCTPDVPTVYCVAAPMGIGCTPTIGAFGVPSASAGSGFDVALAPARNRQAGILFYGVSGATLAPLAQQWLCVAAPIVRTPLQDSGGSSVGDDCTGVLHVDFNARIASGVDPALASGVEVRAQYWTRDAGSATGTYLSNALWFAIRP